MTFYEIQAKSIINRVPGHVPRPVRVDDQPVPGLQPCLRYCFARNTHTYLDLDAGADFDSKVVVKVNAGELLRRELAAPRWRGAHIAMGTNVDCYQRAEGRYRLMPRIIAALRDFANPFSILTKGTLILRDLDLLRQAAEVTQVGISLLGRLRRRAAVARGRAGHAEPAPPARRGPRSSPTPASPSAC